MVKQSTHNRQSESSILSGPTKSIKSVIKEFVIIFVVALLIAVLEVWALIILFMGS